MKSLKVDGPERLKWTVLKQTGRSFDCRLNGPFENFESSWFLEKVKVKNLDDNEEQVFLIRQWLDKNSEKGSFILRVF